MKIYVIRENPDDGTYSVHYHVDVLPAHWVTGPFATAEEAADTEPMLTWHGPDDEDDGDVILLAEGE